MLKMRQPIVSASFSKIALVLVLSFLSGRGITQNLSIKEEARTIKTYPYSDSNPVPSLAINDKVALFYPYFVFDGYSVKGVDKKWKVVTLENDYIKVTVLPEVGGKVWGAIEKSTGREFIYQNHVMKFRSIGIRGPWTSGGIEHNFGLDLGHAPWASGAVDYLLKNNEDGSVSCFVGGLDLASRTEWRVEIRLPEDAAYFETNGMWYNPTPLHDSYLSWENAAYKASDDLQFYFPGTHYIGHNGDAHPWPTDREGRNLSIYKENNFGSHKSYHVMGVFPNWFGGYYHDPDFGTGHWTAYDDAPGKKIWIWALSRNGAIWEDLLTDTDGQYIEAQSGVKFNQAHPWSGYHSPFDQLFLRPLYSELKSEIWFPVKETGGMVAAGRSGTLNMVVSGDSVDLAFCPNVTIEDDLVLSVGNKEVHRESLRLQPLEVWKKRIFLPGSRDQYLDVRIGDDLHYSTNPAQKVLDRPVVTPPGRNYDDAEQLFRVAEDRYSMRNFDGALNTYLECLEKEPTHIGALAKVAEIYYRRLQHEDGLKYARKALEYNTYKSEVNFIYGLLKEGSGNLVQAEEAYSVAARSMEYRSAAFTRIAGLSVKRGRYKYAVTYGEKALDFNRYNIPAREFLAISYRKLGDKEKANKILDEILALDPLDHLVRFEQYLLDPSDEKVKDFNGAIRNELPWETYLELAIKYASHGLDTEAIKVLEQSQAYPSVFYWLAWLYKDEAPEKSKENLEKAVQSDPVLVFPFRRESIPVFRWAQQQYPSWKNEYYLGLIYWHHQREDEARELFSKCGDAPDFAPFYIARGVLFAGDGSGKTEKDFRRALALAPEEWRTWNYLDDYLDRKGEFGQEVESAGKAYARFSEIPEMGIDYARALINAGQPEKALKILNKIKVLPYEGAREGYELYELANLRIAMDLIESGKYKSALRYIEASEIYPENLGTGKPYEPDIRLQDYMAAYCLERTGNEEGTKQHYKKIYEYSEKHWHDKRVTGNVYLAVITYRLMRKEEELDEAMKSWEVQMDSLRNWRIAPGSASPVFQWVLAKYEGKKEKATTLENELSANPAQSKIKTLWEILGVVEDKEGH